MLQTQSIFRCTAQKKNTNC